MKVRLRFSIALSTVLCIARSNHKVRILQNRTAFVISTLFINESGANVTLFLLKGSQLRKRLGTHALAPFFSFRSMLWIGRWTLFYGVFSE